MGLEHVGQGPLTPAMLAGTVSRVEQNGHWNEMTDGGFKRLKS